MTPPFGMSQGRGLNIISGSRRRANRTNKPTPTDNLSNLQYLKYLEEMYTFIQGYSRQISLFLINFSTYIPWHELDIVTQCNYLSIYHACYSATPSSGFQNFATFDFLFELFFGKTQNHLKVTWEYSRLKPSIEDQCKFRQNREDCFYNAHLRVNDMLDIAGRLHQQYILSHY